MFRRQYITIDGHPPALVSPDLHVAVHAIDEGRQLGPEQEDVDTAVLGQAVEGIGDGLLQRASVEVGD